MVTQHGRQNNEFLCRCMLFNWRWVYFSTIRWHKSTDMKQGGRKLLTHLMGRTFQAYQGSKLVSVFQKQEWDWYDWSGASQGKLHTGETEGLSKVMVTRGCWKATSQSGLLTLSEMEDFALEDQLAIAVKIHWEVEGGFGSRSWGNYSGHFYTYFEGQANRFFLQIWRNLSERRWIKLIQEELIWVGLVVI